MKAYFYRLDEMKWTNTPPGNFSPLFNLNTILRETENKPEIKREPLGEKEIQGKHVVGYRITYHTNDGITDHDDVWDLWGDPKTGLPVLVELVHALTLKSREHGATSNSMSIWTNLCSAP